MAMAHVQGVDWVSQEDERRNFGFDSKKVDFTAMRTYRSYLVNAVVNKTKF